MKNQRWDILAGMQFCNLFQLGLRDRHSLLDYGCGMLRAGRLFIPYLKPGQYFAIEPKKTLVLKGIREVGLKSVIEKNKPTFSHNKDCNVNVFKRKFDYILAQSIFSHMSIERIHKSLRTAKQAMHEGTLFLATYAQGLEDDKREKWGKTRAEYRKKTFDGLVKEAGLRSKEKDWPHPGSQTWVVIKR